MTDLILPLEDRYADYLTDESGIMGKADTISFPETEAQVQQIVKTLAGQKIPITVQGSRTGFSGFAVPVCGHILNLSAMKGITGLSRDESGRFFIRVRPGLSLLDLNRQLYSRQIDLKDGSRDFFSVQAAMKKAGPQFWPPDPTEFHASVGGIAATNARGICSHGYGLTRHHIKGIRIVDSTGEVRSIDRGRFYFSAGTQRKPQIKPQIKSDLIDLYLGNDGAPGVITELTLCLIPRPPEIWGIVFFFKDRLKAPAFAEAIGRNPNTGSGAKIAGILYMNQTTLDSIGRYKKMGLRSAELPDMDSEFSGAVYAEIHGNDPGSVEALAKGVLETASGFNADPDDTWAFSGETEIGKAHDFCHAATASAIFQVNTAKRKDPGISRVGVEVQCREGGVPDALNTFETDTDRSGLRACVFGHVGDGHFQVHLLPRDHGQYIKAKALAEKWRSVFTGKNPCIVTEHGIGKTRKILF